MPRKRVKIAWVVNETSRAISLKKRRLGLMKKVRELTILCDVRACIIMFSHNEVAPMVWPSAETAHNLLDNFFALPEIEKKKKETSLESYLKEKTRKVNEQLKKLQKKNLDSVIDQLMLQLHRGRVIADLNMNEIYWLLFFSRDKIMLCRKRPGFAHHPPLRDPPVNPFEAQSEELMTTMNDVFAGRGEGEERARETNELMKRIHIGSAIWGNRSHYVMDQWFPSFEPPKPIIHQPIGMEIISSDEKPNPRSYFTYYGSCSNGNPNLEMEPVASQVMTFHGLAESISQPLGHHNMNDNPIMATSQLMQYPFDFMSHDLGEKEELININNVDLQFQRSINTITTNNGFRQEPPPPNGTNTEESDVDAMSFEITKVWPGNSNHHF